MDDLPIIVLDLETTQNSERKFKADPLDPANSIVMCGLKGMGLSSCASTNVGESSEYWSNCINKSTSALVVGQNIKFDLHYLQRTLGHRLHPEINIWDTQLAEFILTGQQSKTISLDKLAEKYGGTLKDSRVSDMFEAGMGAQDVPEELLKEYLEADLSNTELVFSKQLQVATESGQLPLIISQMGGLRATIEMSYNGLKLDKVWLDDKTEYFTVYAKSTEILLRNQLELTMPYHVATNFNFNSNNHLISLLYTGQFEYLTTEVVGVYKTGKNKGKPRTRKVKQLCTFTPLYNKKSEFEGMYTETGKYKVDADVIDLVNTRIGGNKLLTLLLEYKEINKQLSTYYKGLQEALYPDNYIHPSYNHCIASTGRLTSSNPNLQNITNGEIKRAFISRFEGGSLIEFDYGQLEILGLATITNDRQLIEDITDNVDIHTALYFDMNGKLPTKEERKAFKPLSFGLIYGASANTLAANAGCTVEFAKKFIKTFYNRYPDVKKWHENFPKEVLKNRVPSVHKDEDGMPVGEATWQSATGRKYVFREYKAPDWIKASKGISHNFSPTELKNYPVQGLSTADIVPHMLGIIFQRLTTDENLKDKCLLINTVHDSIMLDCHPDVKDEAIEVVRDILRNTPTYFARSFGNILPFTTMPVGVSVGPNWYDMEELE